jgi:hypothetical protein
MHPLQHPVLLRLRCPLPRRSPPLLRPLLQLLLRSRSRDHGCPLRLCPRTTGGSVPVCHGAERGQGGQEEGRDGNDAEVATGENVPRSDRLLLRLQRAQREYELALLRRADDHHNGHVDSQLACPHPSVNSRRGGGRAALAADLIQSSCQAHLHRSRSPQPCNVQEASPGHGVVEELGTEVEQVASHPIVLSWWKMSTLFQS